MEQIKNIIKKHFQEYQIEITDDKVEQFALYYKTLIETNQKFNLTAITEINEVVVKHFIDSVLAIDLFEENSNIVDIGAGAGFPSIPLKIMKPSLNIIMVDSLNKRVNFLNDTIKLLNLKNIQAVHFRAEDFAKDNFEKFDYVTARAVARLNTLSEYCLPLVKVGGKFIAYKGDNVEEISECENAVKILGGEIKENIIKQLNYGTRNIVVINKIKNTNKKYPRNKNLPRTKPL